MNYKVWKKKHLLVRDRVMGLLGLLKGRFRGDLSMVFKWVMVWGLALFLSTKLERLK